ncbi:MAG: cytochrome c oxidase accessory protein CcoG [Gammaproteobacteria bacterium]|nr:cytochrome c oxidase accessory protein CcoG [Gammaproteobacteria bacterium]
MSKAENSPEKPSDHIHELYEDIDHWEVNTGEETIHAKRMPGMFRNLKWLAASTWLIFFFGPYLRWGDRQAITFDIAGRQFHIFGITILPQDVWMLSLVLLFFAILLAAVTSIAGRVFCGYFCFQTVWTDLFTWIEERLEGKPGARRKADKLPLLQRNMPRKILKHLIWILIGAFTGISFTLWFGDAYEMWGDYFHLNVSLFSWIVVATFTFFTYLFAGFMREQVCLWLCPYARIQGVMLDVDTVVPTYDFHRGEPRARLKKGKHDPAEGDCIECNQCYAVCPTGVDIRNGQQEGCITCGLCLDACDSVMDKIDKPRGLIRYMSLDELQGKEQPPLYRRPRPLIYMSIMLLAAMGIIYGLTHLGSLELRILHERQPLFVLQSDGSIQNKYVFKVLNKTHDDMKIGVTAKSEHKLVLVGADRELLAPPGRTSSFTLFVRIPKRELTAEREPITFTIYNVDDDKITNTYESMFFGPRVR